MPVFNAEFLDVSLMIMILMIIVVFLKKRRFVLSVRLVGLLFSLFV